MDEKEFYRSNNLEKYPEYGLMNQCKKCLTMHVDCWNPDTFLWILEEADVPWVPDEWNKLLAKWAQDPSKVTGTTIVGRYLSKMRLKQHKDYRWKDTEFLQQLANNKIEQAMKQQGYEAADIAKAIQKASASIPEDGVAPAPPPPPPPPQSDFSEYDYFDQQNGITEEDLGIDLTDDDKLMLRLKWGKAYKPEEWVQLEKLYNDMMESYDIQTAGHIDTLKKICKTSLKSDQLLDMGDVDGAQKMIKMYDMLMKSGKFTAAQNKTESGNVVDSISELIAMCERDGFFPRYYVDGPQDKVDRTIQDFQKYTRTLVTEEMNLGNLIENAVRQIQADKEKEAIQDADAAGDDDAFESELFDEDEKAFLNDEDFAQLSNMVDEETIDDEEYLESLLENDEVEI